MVLEGKPTDMGVSAGRDFTPGFERDYVVRTPTFWTSEYFLRRDGKLIMIEKPDDGASRCIASGSCCDCAPTGRSTARRIQPAP